MAAPSLSLNLSSSSITATPRFLSHNQNPFLNSGSLSPSLKKLSLSPLTLSQRPHFPRIPEVSESIQAEVVESIAPASASPPKRQEIFAVVMVGSRQYIVFPGRWIQVQRLKGADVNDKIVLNKVLLVGTKNSTYVGMPIVTNAVVHAVVEEQLLDRKVVVFKYKKKKNYRRNIGHRQPITRIRITGITGFEDYPASTLPS